MRNTKQKDLILKIINNSCTHPNANEIYEKARLEINHISLGTVYRILNNLVENGKIRIIQSIDNIHRYDNINWQHDHFICIKCKEVEDIAKTSQKKINVINNNKVLDCDITYKGICLKCQKKMED